MDSEPNSQDSTTERPTKQNTLLMLFGDIADTTWRMFVPIVGLAAIGLYVDMKFATAPLVTILSALAGTAIAIILVRNQIKKVSGK